MVKRSDVDDLMGYLHDYADKWEAIGTGLDFQPEELNNIKRILTLTTPQQRLRELLCQWIQKGTTTGQVPTMEGLYHVLSSDLVGLGHVAYNIRNEVWTIYLLRIRVHVLLYNNIVCVYVCTCVCVCGGGYIHCNSTVLII